MLDYISQRKKGTSNVITIFGNTNVRRMYFETQYDPRHTNPWLFIRPHLWHGLPKFYVLRLYYLHTKQARDSLAMAFKLEKHLSEEAKNVPNGGDLGVLPCEVRENGLYPKVS